MTFKRIFPLICLIICLFAMTSVCASDANDTAIASEDTGLELSLDNKIEDNLQTNEENPILAVEDNDETVSSQTDSEILTDGQYTYSDLREQIGSGGNKNLTKGTYTYNNDGDTIGITTSGVINGNGAVIDMEGSSIQAFYVNASGVIIKNLTIKNANFIRDGGAIYFMYSGTVENCNFTDNTVTGWGYGGAIWMDSGSVENCNFIGNSATEGYGGAVYFEGNGNVTNCNFIGNSATEGYGGAVYFEGNGNVANCNFTDNTVNIGFGGAVSFEGNGNVINCNFINNKAIRGEGGAVSFEGNGNVINCNFIGNSAWGVDNGAIFSEQWYTTADTCIFKTSSDTTNENTIIHPPILNVDNFTTIYVSGEKLTFDLKTDSGIPVTNGNISISVYYKNNDTLAGNYYCLSGEGWTVDLPVGSYYAIFNTEYAGFQPINRTIKVIPNIKYYANVTSMTTHNRIVNITANSNIPQDILEGKLLFILLNNNSIAANYAGNGIWWAVHTFDDYAAYDVNATYIGLDNVTINNAPITITKANSTITLDNVVLDYEDSIKVNVKTDGTLGIVAMIDGEDVGVVKYSIPISGLDAGIHTLTVTTIPDYDHVEVTKTVNITVNTVDSTLTVDNIVFDYNSLGFTAVSFNGATGVKASVVGQPDAKVNVAGSTITVSGLNAGTYNLTVTTIADANHNNVTKTAKITVNKIKSTLTVGDIVFDYGDSINVNVKTEGALGIKAMIDDMDIEFTVNSSTLVKIITSLIDGEGIGVINFAIPISGLNAGIHTLTVTTIPDQNHAAVTKTVNITVNKLKTSVSGVKVTAAYGNSKNLVITLKDVKGNRLVGKYVTVVLGKTTYKNKITNSKGQITISVPKNLVPKTYAASITFDGDRNYAKSTGSVNVEVKKATPKLTANAKTFKKSAKTKKYTVTLKTNLNKPMKSTWVILKVNKKTYQIKTNAKGQATFKIKNLKKKGTFKATVTYNGDKYYNKVVKKNVKIIVK